MDIYNSIITAFISGTIVGIIGTIVILALIDDIEE